MKTMRETYKRAILVFLVMMSSVITVFCDPALLGLTEDIAKSAMGPVAKTMFILAGVVFLVILCLMIFGSKKVIGEYCKWLAIVLVVLLAIGVVSSGKIYDLFRAIGDKAGISWG